jgi:hypothetical protein
MSMSEVTSLSRDQYKVQYYGLLARFDDAEKVVEAARKVHDAGYRHTDAYSGYPMEELADALGSRRTRIPLITFIGGMIGAVAAFSFMYWTSVIYYPWNVGGRPLNSWPSFIPITFELTVLVAAFTAVIGMLARNGLPRPYHPVFNVPEFDEINNGKFFICIEAADERFDPQATRAFLEELEPKSVMDVPL